MDGRENVRVIGKRKLTALPLLVVLFVISYSLLTRLVIEQDKTIDAQRSLIHSLFQDNISLSTLHKHAAELPKELGTQGDIEVEFGSSAGRNSAKETPSPHGSSPSQLAQIPSNQIPSNQVSTSKAGPQANPRVDRKVRKEEKPTQPEEPVITPPDMRRVAFSI